MFQRGAAWASVGTAVATVATEGQRIVWQPLSVGDGSPADNSAASLPSPADQPASHAGTNGAHAVALPAAYTANGNIPSQEKPTTASQNGSMPAMELPSNKHHQQRYRQRQQPIAVARATEEAAKVASVPAQQSCVQERAPAQSPARSERSLNGSRPSQATASHKAERGVSEAASSSTATATDLGKAQTTQSSPARPEPESHPRASTSSAAESEPAHASAAHPSAHSAALPDPEASTPPDDARSSGASRREARQASGREYVESIIAGAEATWREAGLAGAAGNTNDGGAVAADPREPCLAAQKAAVMAAKVRHTTLFASATAASVTKAGRARYRPVNSKRPAQDRVRLQMGARPSIVIGPSPWIFLRLRAL